VTHLVALRLCFLLSAFFTMTLVQSASAASLRTEVAARRVGVGQSFEVKLTATQADGEPEPQNPQLTVRGKAEVRGPSVGTQRRVMMRNFSFDSETSAVATWIVTPTEKGKLVIGPGTFQMGGKVLRGETIVVEVVSEPQGIPQAGRRRDPWGGGIFGADPSDIFGDDPFDMLSRRLGSRGFPEAPSDYQLSHAPDSVAFLRLLVNKNKVVLGEPVRLTVLAYGSRGNFREVSPNEPSYPDFLSYSVIETSHDEPTYQTSISGQEYIVRKLREYVLIPLRTGNLEIGGMAAVLQGTRGGYPTQGSPLGMKIQSPDLRLQVVDTPSSGRPTGYFPGDVGSYRLSADVNPRTLTEGEFVEVVIQISGVGQIPAKVLLPENRDLTWEQPQVSGGPAVRDGELQGTRVLKYALQVKTSGQVSLGEVTLPYFDHKKKNYQIARADLGIVTVDPSTKDKPRQTSPHSSGNSDANQVDEDFAGVPLKPRAELAPYRQPSPWSPPGWYWWVVLLLPGVVQSGVSSHHFLKRRQALAQENAQRKLAAGHLKAAKQAFSAGNTQGGYKYLERAIYDSMDGATQLKNRGHLREHIADELKRAGIEETLAQDCQSFLLELEELRYDEAARREGDPLAKASQLVARLSREEKRLSKARRKKHTGPTHGASP
jgi:hypothetical protein